MAQAYERASKRVNAVSEAVLAELIHRDVQQLTETALGEAGACCVVGVRGDAASPAGSRHARTRLTCNWLGRRRQGRDGVPAAPRAARAPQRALPEVDDTRRAKL